MFIDVSIENMDHLEEVLRIPEVDQIILPGDRLSPEEWKTRAEQIHRAEKRACLAFPYIFRKTAGDYYQKMLPCLKEAGFDSWLVRSLDEAGFLRETNLTGERIFDQGMYTWNHRAVSVMKKLGAQVLTLPYECRRQELEERGDSGDELVVYGRIPVMISAQCSRKTMGNCRKATGMGTEKAAKTLEYRSLKDRKKAEFQEDCRCRFCYSVIYNSVPLWLLDRVPEYCQRIRFSFTDESVEGIKQILTSWTSGKREPRGEFTRGHFARGVE